MYLNLSVLFVNVLFKIKNTFQEFDWLDHMLARRTAGKISKTGLTRYNKRCNRYKTNNYFMHTAY